MSVEQITGVALPIALAIIMLGLGLTLTLADFKRVVSFPKPVLVGLICQMVLLPAVAFGLCYVFKLQPEFAIGLMILAASPGGVTSNIFSHLANGDVALNLTLTAINSVLSAVSLPLFTSIAISAFAGQDQTIDLQFRKIVEVFLIVLIPAAIGMLINNKAHQFAQRMEKSVRIFSIVVLVVIVAGAISKERALLTEHLSEVGLAVLLFNLLSMGVGYFLPVLLNLPKKQATAISLEVGVHNGTLALYMAISILGATSYAVPAAVYSVLMYFTASAFCWYLKKQKE